MMNKYLTYNNFKKRLILISVILPLLITSCRKNPPITPDADVYMAGFENNANGLVIATYWKNKAAVTLGGGNSEATNIAVQGDNVYAVGFAGGYATCWKNGVAEQLTDNAKDNSFAWAVALKGGDVYVAGAIQLPLDSVYQTNYEAVYWKNGDPVIMNTVNGYANCIDVKGGDVYLGGFSPAAFQTVATYWKNGVRVAVKDTVSSSLAKGIAVSGNDVYLVGYIVNNQGTYMAAYWKNGVTNLLKSNSIATGIVIQGGDIYIAVTSYTVNSLEDGSYYKNGVSVSIEPEKSEMINSIAVQGNDVYLGGSSYNGATYWKNGRLTHLSSDRYSVVNGITVVQK